MLEGLEAMGKETYMMQYKNIGETITFTVAYMDYHLFFTK